MKKQEKRYFVLAVLLNLFIIVIGPICAFESKTFVFVDGYLGGILIAFFSFVIWFPFLVQYYLKNQKEEVSKNKKTQS